MLTASGPLDNNWEMSEHQLMWKPLTEDQSKMLSLSVLKQQKEMQ